MSRMRCLARDHRERRAGEADGCAIKAHRIAMAEIDPRGGDRAPINVFVEWRKAELARLVDESDLPPTRATPAGTAADD